MKKIFYYLVLLFVFFFGINFVDAAECFYKSSDGKVDMVVSGGKAYLLKGYGKGEVGEDGAQERYASWKISGDCSSNSTIYFQAKKGDNKISFSKSTGSNVIKLEKYDFVSQANSATYKYETIDGAVHSLTFKSIGESMAVYYGDKFLTSSSCHPTDGCHEDYLISIASNEYDIYFKSVKNGEFPTLFVNPDYGSGTIYFHFSTVTSHDAVYAEDTKIAGETTVLDALECQYMRNTYYYPMDLKIKLKRMSDATYQYCLTTSYDNHERCAALTDSLSLSYREGYSASISVDPFIYNNQEVRDNYFFFNINSSSDCAEFQEQVCVEEVVSEQNKTVKYEITYASDSPNSCSYTPTNVGGGEQNYDPTACGIFTQELVDMITDALDLIKIAGPIIALVLGTIDFIKAMTSGDSEKELKTAFTRFSKRLVAAIILFLLPIILAFLLDIFLKGQPGYNPDNPYCGVVDWGD